MSHPETVRFKTAPVDLQPEGEGLVAGYAATTEDIPDRYGDVIARGAFRETLADHARRGTTPALLWGHDPSRVVGRWVSMEEDAQGLFVRGQLNLKSNEGREAFEHLRAGDSTGLSIGYQVPPGGQTFLRTGVTRITALDLIEVSLTALPANLNARVTAVKALSSKAELVAVLRSAGLPKAAAARVAAGGWQALAGADHQNAIDLAAAIDEATANLRSL